MIALVLGSAECVDDDAQRALALFDPDCVIAINDMIANWPGPIDHAVSLHVENLPHWLDARAEIQPDRPMTWSHTGAARLGRLSQIADRMLPDWKGSSGLFAVAVARELGMRAVLCGVPMESAHHVAGRSRATWNNQRWPEREVRNYRDGWMLNRNRIAPFVRSMSGWTRDLLGEPDELWLSA